MSFHLLTLGALLSCYITGAAAALKCTTKGYFEDKATCVDQSVFSGTNTANVFTGPGPCFKNGGDPMCYINTAGTKFDLCTCEAGCCDIWPVTTPAPVTVPCQFVPPAPNCADHTAAFNAIYCSQNTTNSACQYCGMKTATCGTKICQIGISLAADKQQILDLHNNYRAKVANGQETLGAPGPQAPAADMIKLVWDDELARTAQAWAEQCSADGGHDAGRESKNNPVWVGQNIAQYWKSNVDSNNPNARDYDKLVLHWFAEVKDFNNGGIDSFDSPAFKNTGVVGHYTAGIWAATKRVGCGFIHVPTVKNGSKVYNQLLYCNYWPGGNVVGSKVYTKGTAGSKCPTGTTKEGSLCKQN